MKILSLNMRGWGNTAKRRRLSSLIQSGGLLTVWKRDLFTFRFSFTGTGFL
ncbi:hypothetical protein L195_g052944, partial [Trifolium pratense]